MNIVLFFIEQFRNSVFRHSSNYFWQRFYYFLFGFIWT